MAVIITGNGIDMGGNPVSNVDVGALDYRTFIRENEDV